MYVHLKIMQNTVNEQWWMFAFLKKHKKQQKNAKCWHPVLMPNGLKTNGWKSSAQRGCALTRRRLMCCWTWNSLCSGGG